MNRLKQALRFLVRVFLKARALVLGTGDFFDEKLPLLGDFLIWAVVSLLMAVVIAFVCVFFGASRSVGIGAGSFYLLYQILCLTRRPAPPRDAFRRGRRVEPDHGGQDEYP